MIHGTTEKKAAALRWKRRQDLESSLPPGHRCYTAAAEDGLFKAVVSKDPAGPGGKLIWHLSVSKVDRHGSPDRCPTWDELKSAKYQLVPEDVCMVLIFPRKSAPYVNVATTCLHLWESTEELDI